jgi:uncharacterized membrane protein YdjX (TVP38/TMEM64 family)
MQKSKIALVVLVGIVLLAAWQLGVFRRLDDPARVRQMLVDLGPWGYVAFIGAYAALQPFGLVPGTVFILAAPLIWPWPVAFALSMVGTMAASVVGFSFSRFIARDWVATKIPARFRKYDEALARRAFATVVVLRLIFWMPPPLHAFFGVSKVSFGTHFWASLVGYAPTLLGVSYFGEKAVEAMKNAPASVWIGVAAVMVAGVLVGWLIRRRRASSPEAPSA